MKNCAPSSVKNLFPTAVIVDKAHVVAAPRKTDDSQESFICILWFSNYCQDWRLLVMPRWWGDMSSKMAQR